MKGRRRGKDWGKGGRRKGARAEEEDEGRKVVAGGDAVRQKENKRTNQTGGLGGGPEEAGRAGGAGGPQRTGRAADPRGRVGRAVAAKRANWRAVAGGSGGRNLTGGSLKRDSCMNREEVSGESVIPK